MVSLSHGTRQASPILKALLGDAERRPLGAREHAVGRCRSQRAVLVGGWVSRLRSSVCLSKVVLLDGLPDLGPVVSDPVDAAFLALLGDE